MKISFKNKKKFQFRFNLIKIKNLPASTTTTTTKKINKHARNPKLTNNIRLNTANKRPTQTRVESQAITARKINQPIQKPTHITEPRLDRLQPSPSRRRLIERPIRARRRQHDHNQLRNRVRNHESVLLDGQELQNAHNRNNNEPQKASNADQLNQSAQ